MLSNSNMSKIIQPAITVTLITALVLMGKAYVVIESINALPLVSVSGLTPPLSFFTFFKTY